MKKIIGGMLLLSCLATAAQSAKNTGIDSTDIRLVNKTKQLLAGYLPSGRQGLYFASYRLGVDTFLQKLEEFKTAAFAVLDKSAAPATRGLAKKDIGIFCVNVLNNYSLYYGTDSVKQAAFYKILETNAKPDSISYYYNATRIRQLTAEQRNRLDSLCFKAPDINDSALFVFSAEYRKYLSDVIQHAMFRQFRADFSARTDQHLIKLKAAQLLFSDAHIRDHFVYEYTGNIIKMSKDSTLKDSVYHAFMAQSVNATQRAQVESFYKNYKLYADNKPAPDFTYVSAGGKKVSLQNLRGKYVYIDVWATWCGPCKKEIPFLAEVEELYHDKNIQFVSLSVDVPGDREKWQQFVKEHQLKGLQLMADNAFDSDFIKKFNINSIPRFILLSPDGKIISADAKRPSDPALKMQLNALL